MGRLGLGFCRFEMVGICGGLGLFGFSGRVSHVVGYLLDAVFWGSSAALAWMVRVQVGFAWQTEFVLEGDSFRTLCGVNPIPASSGKTNWHRLNRGSDRQANAALYRIVLARLRYDSHTKAYLNRRTGEGPTRSEIIRCLKRYVAREVFPALQNYDAVAGSTL